MMLQISSENDKLLDMRMFRIICVMQEFKELRLQNISEEIPSCSPYMKPYSSRATHSSSISWIMIHSACNRRSTTHRLALSSCIVDQQEPDIKPRDNRREHKKTVQIGISFNFLFCFDRSLLKVTLWHGDGMCAWGLSVDQQWSGNLWKLCYWISCDLICADFWLSEGWVWVKTGERNCLWKRF